MAERDDLGQIINGARVGRGQSLGQLADRLGVTAAELRAWEKNESRPGEAALRSLSGVLQLDYGRLAAAAASPVQAPPAPAGRKPQAPREPQASPAGRTDPDTTALVSAGLVFSDAADTGLDVAATTPAAPVEPAPASGGAPRLEDLPTESVATVAPPPAPSPVATVPPPPRPAADADSTLMSGALQPVTGFLRTLFDPDRKYLFWIRTALTIVVILIMLRILAGVVPALFDTLGEILDTIESTTESTVLDQFGNPVTPSSIPGTTITPDG